MSKFLEETPYSSTTPAQADCDFSAWHRMPELHWCEGCGLLIKNGSLIIHPPGNTKALWFCDSRCKKQFDKKGPAVTILNGEDWGCV